MKKFTSLLLISSAFIFAACTTTQDAELISPTKDNMQKYTNEELSYSFEYPSNYTLDTSGLVNSASKSVEVYPLEGKEPYSPIYFDVHLDDRELDFLLNGVFDNSARTEIEFGGQEAYHFIPTEEENSVWIVIPYKDLIYVVASGRTNLPEIQSILESFKFL